jgi:hypothetical protein
MLFANIAETAPDSDLLKHKTATIQLLCISFALPPQPLQTQSTVHCLDSFFIENSRDRLYVPDFASILQDHHDIPAASLPGVKRMLHSLQAQVCWPGMHKVVEAYASSCRYFQLNKAKSSFQIDPWLAFPRNLQSLVDLDTLPLCNQNDVRGNAIIAYAFLDDAQHPCTPGGSAAAVL